MPVSIDKIYVDMDGVLADFEKRYKEIFGKDISRDRKDNNFEKNFMTLINDKHFSTLDKMDGFFELVNYLNSVNIPKEILSSTGRPHKHESVSSQKSEWLEKHGIDWPQIFVPGKHLKKNYATPNSILIDDTKSNITDWNEAGGIGILHTNVESTISMLKMYV